MLDLQNLLTLSGEWMLYSVAAAVGIGLSLLLVGVDAASVPKPSHGPQRFAGKCPKKQVIGHIAAFFLGLFGYALLLAVFNRFWTASVLGVLLIVLLWAGNRLKAAVLDEPLVFSDVFLAGHALRYPRLYFGYAPVWVWPMLAAALAGLGWLVGEEHALGLSVPVRFGILFTLIGIIWLLNEWSRIPNKSVDLFLKAHPLSFTANEDARRYTPIGAAFLHLMWHSRYRMQLRERFICQPMENSSSEGEPQCACKTESPRHIMLIQAESFCPLAKKLKRPSNAPFIDAQIEAGKGGDLELDWRGAYTMRSEFAVLTGLSLEALETYGFDPYRLAAKEPMQSLARVWGQKGYRTIVWHPNDGRFFDRNRVMPNLGFDEFWDLLRLQTEFGERLSKFGRYAADASLLTLAAEFLKKQQCPTFLFIITMEAHGPWHADNFPGAERITEVERYEAHLRSLDRGAAYIGREIEEGHLNAAVLMYGDHIPGIRELDVSPGKEADSASLTDTAWLLLGNADAAALPQRTRPEELGELLVKAAKVV